MVISFLSTFARVSGTAIFSKIVKLSKRLNSWKIKPKFSYLNLPISPSDITRTSLPLIKTFPFVGISIVERLLMKVDLPAPEGPIIHTNSPSYIVSETSCKAS